MSEQERAYYQNLIDAGCTKQAANQMLILLQSGKKGQVCKLLAEYRSELLNRLHTDQRQLDCLDFFIYQIRKN